MKQVKSNLVQYMENLAHNGYFHGAVLVAKGEELLLNEGYGTANVEFGIPNTAKTKIRVASITKGFTAMAILQLHEKDLLDIHDTLNQFIDFPNGDTITIHHLLTHKSGIKDFASFPKYWVQNMRLPSTVETIIESLRNEPLEFEPGTDFSYCNSNYIILTKIIEKVSGLSYSDYLEKNIFEPLKMENSGVDNGRDIIHNLASGYSVWEDVIHPEYIDMSFPQGAYGMYSTIEDLFRWDQALYNDELVSKELLTAMFNPYKHGYGYGWAIWSSDFNQLSNEVNVISHFGDINGYSIDFVRIPDAKITVIVLSNNSITPVMNISRDLLKITLDMEVKACPLNVPIELDEPTRNSLIGNYQVTEQTQQYLITEKHGRLLVTLEKMYGRKYKLGLIPVVYDDQKVIFHTEMINETITILKQNNPFQLLHMDVNKREFAAEKVI